MLTSEPAKMPSEQAFDMVCLGGGVAAGELACEYRGCRVRCVGDSEVVDSK